MSEEQKRSIPIARTSLLQNEIDAVVQCLNSGWLVQGSFARSFEDKWSAFTGANHSIAVTSCTTAMHLSLAALDFKPGDEAIVPAFTWISTANVVEHMGGKVVFCDIDLDTFNLDIDQLESLITSKTKAILPVHLFGLPAQMDAVMAVAKKHNLNVIEDSACGFGSIFNKKHVGTIGHTGCFSFHPRKAITTGEGGMITTQDEELAVKLRRLRDHGAAITDLQRHLGPRPYLLADHPDAGYNQRMTDIQAALGSTQMDRAQDIIDERRLIAKKFDDAFGSLEWLKTPSNPNGLEHGYQSYPCLYQPKEVNLENLKSINKMRNEWMEELQQAGISTRPATHAVHMLSFYKNKYSINPQDFPNAWIANDCSISLPLFHGMSDDEQDYVIEVVSRHLA